MTHWILLFYIYTYETPALLTARFNTEAACQSAAISLQYKIKSTHIDDQPVPLSTIVWTCAPEGKVKP